ncbi:MAG: aldose 1-epimerase family protein [Clostridia bacterium]|nr:aldose 1-epimerase family protein [Clostridia bacterium]
MDGKISNLQQVASLRRYTLTEGKERGLDVLDCDNGKLRFLLNASKACDIMQLYHKGQNVSFLSKNAFTARETDFLTRFEGGMLYTCGLDSVGGREGFPLHGSLHNIPAQIVTARCDEDGILVETVIRDCALFGKNLVLKRKVFSAIGSDSVTVEDTLCNEGFQAQDYCLLYHINVGYPLLDDGAKVVVNAQNTDSRTAWAEQNKATMYEMSDCIVGQEETCYYLDLPDGKAALVNEKLGKAFCVEYSKKTLPHFLEWKSMASSDYALGLEPATTRLDEQFAYQKIGAGEKIAFQICLQVKELEK